MNTQVSNAKPTQELTDADFKGSQSRRRHPRRAAKWQVTVKTTKGQALLGQTLNVSREGALISLPANLSLGDKTFIEVALLHQGKRLTLQAVALVRHASINGGSFNIGFQFTKTTELTSRFLDAYTSKE